jgi:hypothetical protein
MIMNLFSIPVLVGTVDLEKIKFKSTAFTKKWISETITSQHVKNDLDKESGTYLAEVFASKLGHLLKKKFTLTIDHIWENIYDKNDYQEPHIHPGSHFSFVIYKEVKESNTIFFNPYAQLIQCFKMLEMFDENFKPQLTKGQYVIFPSFVTHMAAKSTGTSTIAGNMTIEFKE